MNYFKINYHKALKTFVISCLIASILLIIINFFEATLFSKTNPLFSNKLGLTHVYFGLFIGVCNIIVLSFYLKKETFINLYIDILIIIFNSILLVYIGARMSMIAFFITLIIFTYKKLNLKPIYKLGFLSFLVFFTVLFLSKTPRFQQGFDEFKYLYEIVASNDKEALIEESWKNMPLRYLNLKYTVQEIQKNWQLGIGMQNVKSYVSNKIIDDGYVHFFPINTHNQYLHFFIGMGIIGFIYFLYLLIELAKTPNYNLLFLVFFLIVMLTESVLVRGKGILIFTFFSLLFVNKKVLND
ncbi:O-antigen ligase family protein [Tenacibaculum sp. IB213877]|jgi:O-antigen ligase|uniref:O-antigen ligase family protein n=1 Tax=Tenacibaculum sp. IB213877 TaxID=3097351 RepID=UPI002A5A2BAD|nr:O-antigen ligase family protein [Tenacibaculum sp. IB213877]MDY0780410.1 O-antigen ligase family protein [Tenacibaculum sp. IB213877]